MLRAVGVGPDPWNLAGQARSLFLEDVNPCSCFLGAPSSSMSKDAVLGLNP